MRRCAIVLLLLSVLCVAPEAKSPAVRTLWKASTAKKSHAPRAIRTLWKRQKTSPKNTQSRISASEKSLQNTAAEQEQMNQQLARIARAIKKAELENIAINKVLDRLEKDQKKREAKYQSAKTDIDAFGGKIRKLDTTIRARHERYIRLLSDQFALIAAMHAIGRRSINSVIREEAYEQYRRKNNHELAKLKREIDGSKEAKARLQARQERIRQSIRSIIDKRKLYRKKKAEKEALLASLAKKEEEYRAQLRKLMHSQALLRQTLARLNILRKEEIKQAQAEEAARRAELKRKTQELQALRQAQAARIRAAKAAGEAVNYETVQIASAPAPAAGRVKQYGSSYQANNIQAYRGARTISPLRHARVVKKFGTYIDPIYKIKIFNDNVVLQAPRLNAKIRNVLNGKVVYIGQNSMLGKVVIVEHGNRLHTIYAALDRISPMLHTGSRVKKGTIIGRVKRKLIFQATQNSKYINPLRLIRL